MKKIILKARLENRDNFEGNLSEANLNFSPIYWQHDRIYVPRNYRPHQNYPRLTMRTNLHAVNEEPTYHLILRRHIEDSGVDLVEETPVTDYLTTVNIIFELGFEQIAEVSRRRKELSLEDEGSTIYLDDIDGRDDEHYVKIEANLRDTDSVAKVKSDLEKTLRAFGESNFVNRPYFEL